MNNRLNYEKTHALVEYCRAHVTEHAHLTYDAIAAEASAVLAFPVTYKNVIRARREVGLSPRRVAKPKAAPASAPETDVKAAQALLTKMCEQLAQILENQRSQGLRMAENERAIAALETEQNNTAVSLGEPAPFPATKPNGASKGAKA